MNNLEEAASLIENGWCTGELAIDGKYCSVGALGAVLGVDTAANPFSETAEQAYKVVAESKEGKALADEIMESEWFNTLGHLTRVSVEDAYFAKAYDEVIWYFNDYQTQMEPVVEMFKYAAKRL